MPTAQLPIARCNVLATAAIAVAFACSATASAQELSNRAATPVIHGADQAHSSGSGFVILESSKASDRMPPMHSFVQPFAPAAAQPRVPRPATVAEAQPMIHELPEECVFQFVATAATDHSEIETIPPPEEQAVAQISVPEPAPVARMTARAGDEQGPAARLVLGGALKADDSPRVSDRLLSTEAFESPIRDAAVIAAAFQEDSASSPAQELPGDLEEILPPSVEQTDSTVQGQDELPHVDLKKASSLSEIQFEIRRHGSVGAEGIADDYPEMVSVPSQPASSRTATQHLVEWEASDLRYRRPYFEQVMLERHGLSRRPLLQLAFSAGRFFTTATFFPEIMLVRRPHDMFSHRAYGRSGSPLEGAYYPDDNILLPRFGPSDPLPSFSTILAPEVISEPLEMIDALESTGERSDSAVDAPGAASALREPASGDILGMPMSQESESGEAEPLPIPQSPIPEPPKMTNDR